MAATKTKVVETQQVEILETPPLKKHLAEFSIIGDSLLMVHNWSAKALGQMAAEQFKATWPKKLKKNPVYDFNGATYWIDEQGHELDGKPDLALIADGHVTEYIKQAEARLDALAAMEAPRFGFPAKGLKACAIRGAKALGLVMTEMRASFFIPLEYIEIHGVREMDCAMVRVGRGGTDIRFRPRWNSWWMRFPVEVYTNLASLDMVANIMNAGGATCGLGEDRPEKGAGGNGRFHVASDAEIAKLK